MAEIINVSFRKIEDEWILSIVKNDNFQEIEEKDISSVSEEFNKILKFANTIKTKDQKAREEAEEAQKGLVDVLMTKTTEAERVDMAKLMPRWRVGKKYVTKDERTYNDILYVCKEDHKSSYETIPPNAAGYWRKAEKERIKPEDYNNEKKYTIGEKCYWAFNKHVYVSIVEQEGQSPFASPTTWEDEGEF